MANVIDWAVETPQIKACADLHNVDHFYIMAIRAQEDGKLTHSSIVCYNDLQGSDVWQLSFAGHVKPNSTNPPLLLVKKDLSLLNATTAVVVVPQSSIDEIQKNIEKQNAKTTSDTPISIDNEPKITENNIQSDTQETNSVDTLSVFNAFTSGLKFNQADAAVVADTTKTSLPYISIIEILNKSFSASNPIDSPTKIWSLISQKLPSVTSCVVIAIPSTINLNWKRPTLSGSSTILISSLKGIWLVDYQEISGREFGVLSQAAPSYADQLRVCVATVAHRLESFVANPLQRDPFGVIMYSPKWIAYFASIWAPVGVDVQNDPNGLNKNWLPNVLKFYDQFRNGHI